MSWGAGRGFTKRLSTSHNGFGVSNTSVFISVTEKNFKAIWDKKRELLSNNPEKAFVTVKADSQLVEGFMSRVKVRDFEVIVDQHEGMGGFDKGPSSE